MKDDINFFAFTVPAMIEICTRVRQFFAAANGLRICGSLSRILGIMMFFDPCIAVPHVRGNFLINISALLHETPHFRMFRIFKVI